MYKKVEDIILDTIICRSLEETTNCPSGEYITTPDLSTCSTNMEDIKNIIIYNTHGPEHFKQSSKSTAIVKTSNNIIEESNTL